MMNTHTLYLLWTFCFKTLKKKDKYHHMVTLQSGCVKILGVSVWEIYQILCMC